MLNGNVENKWATFQDGTGKAALSPLGYSKPCVAFPSTELRTGLDDFFEHSLQVMMAVSSWACICHGNEIFNSP
jgi:hypothetical protein